MSSKFRKGSHSNYFHQGSDRGQVECLKHWKSQYDCEQAQVFAGAYRDKLDMDYLKTRMKEEDLEMELLEIFKS